MKKLTVDNKDRQNWLSRTEWACMNVSLTPELEMLVARRVQSGRYGSASEVIRTGLRLLEEDENRKEAEIEYLRREIVKGVEDIKEGRYMTLETKEDFRKLAEKIKQDGRRRINERRKKKGAEG